jgi:hypothetical protein
MRRRPGCRNNVRVDEFFQALLDHLKEGIKRLEGGILSNGHQSHLPFRPDDLTGILYQFDSEYTRRAGTTWVRPSAVSVAAIQEFGFLNVC